MSRMKNYVLLAVGVTLIASVTILILRLLN